MKSHQIGSLEGVLGLMTDWQQSPWSPAAVVAVTLARFAKSATTAMG
jgi:hypothetical protein